MVANTFWQAEYARDLVKNLVEVHGNPDEQDDDAVIEAAELLGYLWVESRLQWVPAAQVPEPARWPTTPIDATVSVSYTDLPLFQQLEPTEDKQ